MTCYLCSELLHFKISISVTPLQLSKLLWSRVVMILLYIGSWLCVQKLQHGNKNEAFQLCLWPSLFQGSPNLIQNVPNTILTIGTWLNNTLGKGSSRMEVSEFHRAPSRNNPYMYTPSSGEFLKLLSFITCKHKGTDHPFHLCQGTLTMISLNGTSKMWSHFSWYILISLQNVLCLAAKW